MQKFKIVADSSADLSEFNDFPFSSAPLKIITDEKEYRDDKNLNIETMVNELSKYKGRSSTSCPNPEDWLRAFGDAENIFCLPITKTLSGSYNSANIAKNLYEEMYPERKVYVFDTLTTGPELKLMIEKIFDLISKGKEFSEICQETEEYNKKTGLLFILKSMRTLVNNGRISPLAAKAAGLLGIQAIGKASDQGDLQPLDKVRGEEKTLDTVILRMKEMGFKKGKVRITHCLNLNAATLLAEKLKKEFENSKIEIYKCGALCSFYAEKGGMIIGFEKF